LRRVADVIRRNIREGDWLARWGGDEFVLVLWDTSVFSSPESLLQRISRDLKASPVCLPQGPELVLSISAGARTCSGGETPQELLSEADKAMYDAKRQGRPWVLSA
jgi:diguanylate cyclase (GGDEF)-like protein